MRGSGVESLPEGLKGFLRILVDGLRRLDPGVEVYLAGSWARGDWLLDSDVDLIVVSRRFKGLTLGERFRLVKDLAPPGRSLDILAYTPEEFENARKRSVVLRDMMEYAVKLS